MPIDLSKYVMPFEAILRNGECVTVDRNIEDDTYTYGNATDEWKEDGSWLHGETCSFDIVDIPNDTRQKSPNTASILERLADPHRNHDDDMDEAGQLLREACCFLRSHMALCECTSLARDTAEFIKLIEQGEDQ